MNKITEYNIGLRINNGVLQREITKIIDCQSKDADETYKKEINVWVNVPITNEKEK